MKPRQIKKNSKHAMKLLLKLFPKLYQEHHFEYDDCSTNEYFTFAPTGGLYLDYGECEDVVSASLALFDAIRYFHKNWNRRTTIQVSGCYGEIVEIPKLNATWQQLLTECRKLAKAGVRFK